MECDFLYHIFMYHAFSDEIIESDIDEKIKKQS